MHLFSGFVSQSLEEDEDGGDRHAAEVRNGNLNLDDQVAGLTDHHHPEVDAFGSVNNRA